MIFGLKPEAVLRLIVSNHNLKQFCFSHDPSVRHSCLSLTFQTLTLEFASKTYLAFSGFNCARLFKEAPDKPCQRSSILDNVIYKESRG